MDSSNTNSQKEAIEYSFSSGSQLSSLHLRKGVEDGGQPEEVDSSSNVVVNNTKSVKRRFSIRDQGKSILTEFVRRASAIKGAKEGELGDVNSSSSSSSSREDLNNVVIDVVGIDAFDLPVTEAPGDKGFGRRYSCYYEAEASGLRHDDSSGRSETHAEEASRSDQQQQQHVEETPVMVSAPTERNTLFEAPSWMDEFAKSRSSKLSDPHTTADSKSLPQDPSSTISSHTDSMAECDQISLKSSNKADSLPSSAVASIIIEEDAPPSPTQQQKVAFKNTASTIAVGSDVDAAIRSSVSRSSKPKDLASFEVASIPTEVTSASSESPSIRAARLREMKAVKHLKTEGIVSPEGKVLGDPNRSQFLTDAELALLSNIQTLSSSRSSDSSQIKISKNPALPLPPSPATLLSTPSPELLSPSPSLPQVSSTLLLSPSPSPSPPLEPSVGYSSSRLSFASQSPNTYNNENLQGSLSSKSIDTRLTSSCVSMSPGQQPSTSRRSSSNPAAAERNSPFKLGSRMHHGKAKRTPSCGSTRTNEHNIIQYSMLPSTTTNKNDGTVDVYDDALINLFFRSCQPLMDLNNRRPESIRSLLQLFSEPLQDLVGFLENDWLRQFKSTMASGLHEESRLSELRVCDVLESDLLDVFDALPETAILQLILNHDWNHIWQTQANSNHTLPTLPWFQLITTPYFQDKMLLTRTCFCAFHLHGLILLRCIKLRKAIFELFSSKELKFVIKSFGRYTANYPNPNINSSPTTLLSQSQPLSLWYIESVSPYPKPQEGDASSTARTNHIAFKQDYNEMRKFLQTHAEKNQHGDLDSLYSALSPRNFSNLFDVCEAAKKTYTHRIVKSVLQIDEANLLSSDVLRLATLSLMHLSTLAIRVDRQLVLLSSEKRSVCEFASKRRDQIVTIAREKLSRDREDAIVNVYPKLKPQSLGGSVSSFETTRVISDIAVLIEKDASSTSNIVTDFAREELLLREFYGDGPNPDSYVFLSIMRDLIIALRYLLMPDEPCISLFPLAPFSDVFPGASPPKYLNDVVKTSSPSSDSSDLLLYPSNSPLTTLSLQNRMMFRNGIPLSAHRSSCQSPLSSARILLSLASPHTRQTGNRPPIPSQTPADAPDSNSPSSENKKSAMVSKIRFDEKVASKTCGSKPSQAVVYASQPSAPSTTPPTQNNRSTTGSITTMPPTSSPNHTPTNNVPQVSKSNQSSPPKRNGRLKLFLLTGRGMSSPTQSPSMCHFPRLPKFSNANNKHSKRGSSPHFAYVSPSGLDKRQPPGTAELRPSDSFNQVYDTIEEPCSDQRVLFDVSDFIHGAEPPDLPPKKKKFAALERFEAAAAQSAVTVSTSASPKKVGSDAQKKIQERKQIETAAEAARKRLAEEMDRIQREKLGEAREGKKGNRETAPESEEKTSTSRRREDQRRVISDRIEEFDVGNCRTPRRKDEGRQEGGRVVSSRTPKSHRGMMDEGSDRAALDEDGWTPGRRDEGPTPRGVGDRRSARRQEGYNNRKARSESLDGRTPRRGDNKSSRTARRDECYRREARRGDSKTPRGSDEGRRRYTNRAASVEGIERKDSSPMRARDGDMDVRVIAKSDWESETPRSKTPREGTTRKGPRRDERTPRKGERSPRTDEKTPRRRDEITPRRRDEITPRKRDEITPRKDGRGPPRSGVDLCEARDHDDGEMLDSEKKRGLEDVEKNPDGSVKQPKKKMNKKLPRVDSTRVELWHNGPGITVMKNPRREETSTSPKRRDKKLETHKEEEDGLDLPNRRSDEREKRKKQTRGYSLFWTKSLYPAVSMKPKKEEANTILEEEEGVQSDASNSPLPKINAEGKRDWGAVKAKGKKYSEMTKENKLSPPSPSRQPSFLVVQFPGVGENDESPTIVNCRKRDAGRRGSIKGEGGDLRQDEDRRENRRSSVPVNLHEMGESSTHRGKIVQDIDDDDDDFCLTKSIAPRKDNNNPFRIASPQIMSPGPSPRPSPHRRSHRPSLENLSSDGRRGGGETSSVNHDHTPSDESEASERKGNVIMPPKNEDLLQLCGGPLPPRSPSPPLPTITPKKPTKKYGLFGAWTASGGGRKSTEASPDTTPATRAPPASAVSPATLMTPPSSITPLSKSPSSSPTFMRWGSGNFFKKVFKNTTPKSPNFDQTLNLEPAANSPNTTGSQKGDRSNSSSGRRGIEITNTVLLGSGVLIKGAEFCE